MSSLAGDIPPSRLYVDKGSGIVVGNAVVGVMAAIAVVLRIASRRLKRIPLGPDDWLIVAALVILVVFSMEELSPKLTFLLN